jgi:dephospho-CoA kinase
VSDHTHIPVVGIVGGIGSGKSSLVLWVAARHDDVAVINGDEVGHEVLTDPAVRNALVSRFGGGVFDARNEVDRGALGRMVFGPTAEQQNARRQLEQIVHPRIRETFQRRIDEALAAGKRIVLLDAAVLFEAGWNDLCHAVVYIDVPRNQRAERLRRTRNWDEAELSRREQSQIPLETKKSRADFVVENCRSLDESGRRLEQLLTQIRANFR